MNNQEFLDRLKVIDDNTRLTILQMLAKKGTLCACEILQALDITQATLSYHMKVLVEAGLVSVIKEGKWCYYTIVKEKICDLAYFLEDICCNVKETKFEDCKCCD